MHNDNELFTIAQALLEQRHTPPVHTVAAALRCQSGEVISAVNIDHFLGFVCAETAALAIAINRGVYDFDSVVAVRKNDDTGKIEIVDIHVWQMPSDLSRLCARYYCLDYKRPAGNRAYPPPCLYSPTYKNSTSY